MHLQEARERALALAGWVRVCGSGPPEAGPAGRTFPGYYGAGTARWWRR